MKVWDLGKQRGMFGDQFETLGFVYAVDLKLSLGGINRKKEVKSAGLE